MNSNHPSHTELLHSVKQRATPGRLALLRALESAGTPLSTRGLAKKMGHALDQATLYRALESLTVAGIVRRVDFQHPHAHYELAAGKAHHHHIICKQCGTTEDIEHCIVEDLEKRVLKGAKKFSSIQEHSLEFFGICKKCAA